MISVIIPSFNQGEYIKEAIASLAVQTFQDFEAIVIDDGSTDDTKKIVAELCDRFSWLQYVYQSNAGVVHASNNGLALAQGEYVLRLDADDYIPTNYLQEMVNALKGLDNSVGFSYCDAYYVGARTGLAPAQPFNIRALLRENYIHVSGLVRIDAARKVGYFNPKMTHGLEDWDFWLALVSAGYTGVYVKSTHLCYRIKNTPSRNHLAAGQYRAMRTQVYKNHPTLFNTISGWLAVQTWRIDKKWEGLSAKIFSGAKSTK